MRWVGARVCFAAGCLVASVSATSGCDDSTGPRYVDLVRLLPDSAHVPVGESFEFRIAVFDQRGDSLPDRVSMVELVNRNPEFVEAMIDAGRLHVNGLQPGVARIEMRLGFGTGTADIFVPPARVDRIEIDPSPILIDNGGGVDVHARLFDSDGNELPTLGHRISWVVPGHPATVGVRFTPSGSVSSLRAETFPTSALPQQRTLILVVDDREISTDVTIR